MKEYLYCEMEEKTQQLNTRFPTLPTVFWQISQSFSIAGIFSQRTEIKDT